MKDLWVFFQALRTQIITFHCKRTLNKAFKVLFFILGQEEDCPQICHSQLYEQVFNTCICNDETRHYLLTN